MANSPPPKERNALFIIVSIQFHNFISYNTPLLFGDNVTKTLPYAERALVTLIFDGQPMECKTNIFELKPTIAHNAWVLYKERFQKPFLEPIPKESRDLKELESNQFRRKCAFDCSGDKKISKTTIHVFF